LADCPLLQDLREAHLAARGVAGIGTLLSAITSLGVQRMVCEAGLKAEDLGAAPLAPGVERAGVASFLGAVGSGQIVSL
jgi:predicted peroxiredoxin